MKNLVIVRCSDGRLARTSPSERSRWLTQLKRSGLSPSEFATQQGLRLSTLRRWLKRNSPDAPPPAPVRFQEYLLGDSPPPSTQGWDVECTLPNGVTLRTRGQFADNFLRAFWNSQPS